jgi:hypothetical protein
MEKYIAETTLILYFINMGQTRLMRDYCLLLKVYTMGEIPGELHAGNEL